MSITIGRAKQHPRGGMAGGIRGNFGSRADGAAGLPPTNTTPTPDSNQYTRPGLPLGVNLSEYINKAAVAQAEPGLPRGFWISDDEYVPLPAGYFSYATDAEGIDKMLEAKHAREHGLPVPPGSPPKLIAIDEHGITKRLSTIRPGATTAGAKAQASCSTSIELHRPTPRREDDRNGPQCMPEEDEEFEIKEEVH